MIQIRRMNRIYRHIANSGKGLRAVLMAAVLLMGSAAMAQVEINGSVYGGGNKADVLGNTTVKMEDGYVFNGIFGGGLSGSVGTFERKTDEEYVNVYGHTPHEGCIGKPVSCADNTGKCTIVVSGGQIGPVEVATEGMTRASGPVEEGWVWGGGRGLVESPADNPDVHFTAYVNETDVTIKGNAFILESIIGGGEFGRVLGNTKVKIEGGQIGVGAGKAEDGKPVRYTEEQWNAAIAAVRAGNASDINAAAAAMPACSHFNYEAPYNTFDPYADEYAGSHSLGDLSGGSTSTANVSDGKTWIGCVFGGGSGYYPYKTTGANGNITDYDWVHSAGLVEGNTEVIISGGHILTNVYGANEYTDVKGNSKVEMSGGTIGVPRTKEQIEALPMCGFLFGAGKGDPRSHFDTFTNVKDVEIEVKGGVIFGSVYGGSEDGHVGGDVTVNIKKNADSSKPDPIIGTWGNSLVEGNVFGGGRGFSGTNPNAGSIEGKVEINIEGGTILSSVYGGGEKGITEGSVSINVAGGDIKDDVYGGGALANTNTANWNATNSTWSSETSKSTLNTTTVSLTGGTIHRNVYGGGLGRRAVEGQAAAVEAKVYGDVLVNLNQGVAANVKGCAVVGNIFGCNNANGSPQGDVEVHVYGTQNAAATQIANTAAIPAQGTEGDPDYVAAVAAVENAKVGLRYDVNAVYGGGNEAAYVPVSAWNGTTGSRTKVIIEGCDLTSIEYVYGGGNAAAVPETNVEILGAYEIGYVYGGGNGKDDTSYGANPGADVGQYHNGTSMVDYGTGIPYTKLQAGLIHEAYGGSNQKGVIKGDINMVTNPLQTTDPNYCCALTVAKVVGAGKYADIDKDVNLIMGCASDSKVDVIFAGADNANVHGNVTLTITSGNYGKVFGGNNESGAIKGKITVNICETTCLPINIDELYLGGNQAGYSIYGYYDSGERNEADKPIYLPRESASDSRAAIANPASDATHTFPYADPVLNVISATHIGKVFGGGWGETAKMYASPTVNINMIPGAFADEIDRNGDGTEDNNPHALGDIEDVFGGGYGADVYGTTTVNIGTEATVVQTIPLRDENDIIQTEADNVTYKWTTETRSVEGARITGNVYGGGYSADVKGNTQVNICAKKASSDTDYTSVTYTGTGFEGVKILGNVYGGGDLGSVGTFSYATASYNGKNPGSEVSTGVFTGKPTGFTANTGKSSVVIMGDAEIGPDNMKMYHLDASNAIPADDTPDDKGHVFGAGKGKLEAPSSTSNVEYISYVDNTEVTIGGNAFVKGSVYGGSENGHVLHDTYVYIKGGQIGCGKNTTQRHPGTVWEYDYPISEGTDLECASWDYGKDTDNDGVNDLFAPYDPNANATGELGKYSGGASTEGGRKIASDGHTYYGNVFGGGSGSIPYFDTTEGVSKYLSTAGMVEGNTNVEISGGHILTSVYGGCETTNVLGTANVTMTGGTIGVPRTDAQIIAHPVTGYLFGAGKGDQRIFFNKETNVNDAVVKVEGGRIYGSVYGGGEDGHVLRNVTLAIKEESTATRTIIGTRGTSYYDGNVFGGGRGFGGEALTAGNVGGAVTMNIEGGSMLGSVYGGGRLASVGYGLYLSTGTEAAKYGKMRADDEYDGSYKNPSDEAASTFFTLGRGKIFLNISGGTIGNTVANAQYGGNVFGGSMGRLTRLDGSLFSDTHWPLLATAKQTTVNVTGGTIYRSVYGGGEMGTVTEDASVSVSGGKIGISGNGGVEYGNVYGGGKGYVDPIGTNYITAGIVKGNTSVTISETAASGTTPASIPTIYHNIYGGGAYGSVGDFDYDTTTGVPTGRKANTTGGKATVTILGGLIGSNGHENGMIFGSSRGDVGAPGSIHDRLAWVYDTEVVIGGSGSNPQINGSVYGGGENGHNIHDAEVKIHSGTIGIEDTSVDGGAAYPSRGNVYGGGCGTDTYPVTEGTGDEAKTYRYFNRLAGIVLGNTTVTMDEGYVVRNVYGGGAMGSVGTFTRSTTDASTHVPGTVTGCASGSGLSTVTISGGKIGPADMTMPMNAGMVFGAGRGEVHNLADYPNLERVIYTGSTQVNVSGGLVRGSVYGGSESGHVQGDTEVNVSGGQIGWGKGATAAYSDWSVASLAPCDSWEWERDGDVYDPYANASGYNPDGGTLIAKNGQTFYGNVFGGGSGREPWAAGEWLRSAGIVEGSTTVNVTGGHILSNVYGGNECTDVDGSATVTMSGGTVGVPRTKAQIDLNPALGHIFGAGKGDKRVHFNTWTNVDNTIVSVTGGTIYGSVYGGGEDGHVLHDAVTTIDQASGKNTVIGITGESGYDGNVFGGGHGSTSALTAGVVGGNITLTIKNGDMKGSVYGGGKLASVGTNFTDPDDETKYGILQTPAADHGNITINLQGGTIRQNVFGGGMGTTDNIFNTADKLGISRNTTVNLNRMNQAGETAYLSPTDKGCVVLGNIFGCNNTNTSPQGEATVNIYATQRPGGSNLSDKATGNYDIHAVYGGGNLAAYESMLAGANVSTHVNIYGCGYTSVQQVYGGGNAASTPSTHVDVYETYEIDEVFGGGNGKDDILPEGSTTELPNPGANVGYRNYNEYITEGTTTTARDKANAATKELRVSNYSYGTGDANVTIHGGTVHRVYGGSNTKGNVRISAVTMLEDVTGCEFSVDEAYGGGKSAPMDATSKLEMACIPGLKTAYGGAEAAEIEGDVELTITNGTYDRVFGGNNISGHIKGKITVNIEETGCKPLIIGQLYGGGNQAAYTPMTAAGQAEGITMNVRSFTSIGDIYGGGYGESATVNADTHVNINVSEGKYADGTYTYANGKHVSDYTGNKTITFTEYLREYNESTGEWDFQYNTDGSRKTITPTVDIYLPPLTSGMIGAINNVFGGGNAAKVVGNTNVSIGTKASDVFVTPKTKMEGGTETDTTDAERTKEVKGADIRGNVYGGGNKAEVTGNTNVIIGKEEP